MIQWKGSSISGISLYDPATLSAIADAHDVLERQAGLGNVRSLESLRRWLHEAGDDNIATVKRYVGILPEHLVHRFIDKDENAVLVTARLPDIDASEILPVVEKIDRALDPVRTSHPGYEISVDGLPAIAARNSARMIDQLDASIPILRRRRCDLARSGIPLGIRRRDQRLARTLPGHGGGHPPLVPGGRARVRLRRGADRHLRARHRCPDPLPQPAETRGGGGRCAGASDPPRPRARGAGDHPHHVVLAFGLGVTVFSDLPSLRTFGLVCGVTLLASLIADLVFLPATILLYRRLVPSRR